MPFLRLPESRCVTIESQSAAGKDCLTVQWICFVPGLFAVKKGIIGPEKCKCILCVSLKQLTHLPFQFICRTFWNGTGQSCNPTVSPRNIKIRCDGATSPTSDPDLEVFQFLFTVSPATSTSSHRRTGGPSRAPS